MNSSVSTYCDFRSVTRASALPATYVNCKKCEEISRSEISYYCFIHIPTFHIVLLLRILSFGGKLCLRDDKNTAFV